MHLGSFRVWRVPIGGYKIHGEKLASFSQIPSITSSMFTFAIDKQRIQVIVQPHAFHVIFDLTESKNDDDMFIIPNPFTSTSPIQGNFDNMSNMTCNQNRDECIL